MECCALSDGKDFESRTESWKMSVSCPPTPGIMLLKNGIQIPVLNPFRLLHFSNQLHHHFQSTRPHTQPPSSASLDSKLHHQASSTSSNRGISKFQLYTLVRLPIVQVLDIFCNMLHQPPCASTTKPSSTAATLSGATASSNAHASTARARPAV